MLAHHLVAHHLGGEGQLPAQQGLVHDHHGEPGGGHVLLGSGIDEPEAGHIHGTGQDIGGHVCLLYTSGWSEPGPAKNEV